MMSGIGSRTVSRIPLVNVRMVSGRDSTSAMSSALTTTASPFSCVRLIMGQVRLALELHQRGVVLVRRLDRLAVRLEAALQRDHLDELVRQVHVGLLQRPGDDLAAGAGAGGADHG